MSSIPWASGFASEGRFVSETPFKFTPRGAPVIIAITTARDVQVVRNEVSKDADGSGTHVSSRICCRSYKKFPMDLSLICLAHFSVSSLVRAYKMFKRSNKMHLFSSAQSQNMDCNLPGVSLCPLWHERAQAEQMQHKLSFDQHVRHWNDA
jgi:hypothetical protein